MKLNKFKITADKCSGHMVVVYSDGHFKSVLNEFNPPLSEVQLNLILNHITSMPDDLVPVFVAKFGTKVKVEPVKAIGAEPALDAAPGYPVNEKIALWCEYYAKYHTDGTGAAVKYKTGAAEAGKLKGLPVTPEELTTLFDAYFKANVWWNTPKSISNFVKKYNEVRALAYANAPVKQHKFPIPFDAVHFARLDTVEKRQYHEYLKAEGYKYVPNPGSDPRRGGQWIKNDHTVTTQ